MFTKKLGLFCSKKFIFNLCIKSISFHGLMLHWMMGVSSIGLIHLNIFETIFSKMFAFKVLIKTNIQNRLTRRTMKNTYIHITRPVQSSEGNSSAGWNTKSLISPIYTVYLHRDKMLLHFMCKWGNLNAVRTEWDAAPVVLWEADFLQKASSLLSSHPFPTSVCFFSFCF